MALPEGWRSVRLPDLLSDGLIRKLVPIMNEIQAGHLDISAGKKKILALLKTEEAALMAKEVLPDYLAWYLAYQATVMSGQDLNQLLMN